MNPRPRREAPPFPDRHRHAFLRLVQPRVGVMEDVGVLAQDPTAPRFEVGVTSLGNLTMTFPHVSTQLGTSVAGEPLGGAGADLDAETAWIKAVAEGAERYCTMAHDEDDFVVASGRDLGEQALDLRTVPRCSDREYADPACPLRPADASQPIRWALGYSLVDGCERYVPAVMSHLYVKPRPAERFWLPISTGVAAHTNPIRALVVAICESIERDAITLTWLLRLPLARIDLTPPLDGDLEAHLSVQRHSLVQHHLFDATTDIGIPTVYAVQVRSGHPRLSQYVNCATDFDVAAACAKTMREAAPAQVVLQTPHPLPDRVTDFTHLQDGAVYMGRPERRRAFDFLLRGRTRRRLDEIQIADPRDDLARLELLVNRLRALGTDAVAVDLTTDEVRQGGLWVIRVVVPGFLPMSPVHRARFLGHPRLYRYGVQAGRGRLTEDRINPDPQPFA